MAIRIALVAALGWCGASLAAEPAPSHALALQRVDADYEAARARCDPLAGQVQEICLAAARAARLIEKADIAARAQGTSKARYDAQIARAEAEFVVAKERCGLRAGAARELCTAEARVAEARSKDEARRARREAERREQALRQ